MNAQSKEFLASLVALCRKNNVRIESSDDYDGDEYYAGTRQRFVGQDGISLDMQDIEEALANPV